MAQYAVTTTGNVSTAANNETITFVATASTSGTTSDVLGTPAYTNTFTAPNTTDAAAGVGVFITSNSQADGTVYRATLQEDAGAGFVDTVCTADVTLTGGLLGANIYIYFKAATPYTFTTTTANKYRWSIVRVSGSGGLFRLRTSTASGSPIWGFFVDTRTGTPGASDNIVVTTGVTATLTDGMSFGNPGGTSQSMTPTVFTQQAVITCATGVLSWDTSANTTVTIKGMIVFDYYAELNIGTIATPYPSAYVAKLIHDMDGTAGKYGIWTQGGDLIINGAAPTAYVVDYVSGTGTTADPLITSGDLGVVGDEILVSTTNNYNQTEYKFIITKNSATSYVLADTAGGAESGLSNTHTNRAKVANLQRNIIIEPANTSHPNYIQHIPNTTLGKVYLKNFRTNYIGNSGVGKFGITLGYSTSQGIMTIEALDGIVHNRPVYSGVWFQSNKTDYRDYYDNIFCRSASNQPQMTMNQTANKNLNRFYFFDNNASGIGWNSGNNMQINDCIFHGNNTGNGSNGGHILVAGICANNSFTNNDYQAARRGAIRNISGTIVGAEFDNCSFGDVYTNQIDFTTSSNVNDILFANCTFSSATLISGYENMVEGSEVKYQNMDSDDNKHRWYRRVGSAWSSGTGLTDTTVRTAGSLSLVLKPEDNTDGMFWQFQVPANPTSQVNIFGYGYRNSTFSSGTFKVELFLPGTLVTETPDATYTFPTTTSSWLPFNISAYYSGTVARYAIVRITAVTNTAGAYAFIDDIYDAGTINKVAGLDLWDKGKPSPIMVSTDTSSVPAQVWAFPDTGTSANTMGQRQVDAADDAELAAIK